MLASINKGFDIDSQRILRMTQIIMKPTKDNDDFHFIDSFYKNYSHREITQLKLILQEEEYRKLIGSSKCIKLQQNEVYIDQQSDVDIINIIQGTLVIKVFKDGQETQNYQLTKNKCFFSEFCQQNQYQIVNGSEQSIIQIIGRTTYNEMMDNSEKQEKIQKLECLQRMNQRLCRYEDKQKLLDQFEFKTYQKGEIISTSTSGINRLCLIVKGQVGLFYPQKIKDNYIFFAILQKDQVFNDSYQLFQISNGYNCLILQDKTQILIMKQIDYKLDIINEDIQDQLRAENLSRKILYRNFNQNIQMMDSNQLHLFQQQLFQRYDLNIKCTNSVYEHERNGKVVTTEQFNCKDKSIAKFDEFMMNNKDKQVKGGNKQMIMGTNRIVGRNVDFNNMNVDKQRSLLKLQQIGGMLKKPEAVNQSSQSEFKKVKNLQAKKKSLMGMI